MLHQRPSTLLGLVEPDVWLFEFDVRLLAAELMRLQGESGTESREVKEENMREWVRKRRKRL
jgi:hypothetical protein